MGVEPATVTGSPDEDARESDGTGREGRESGPKPDEDGHECELYGATVPAAVHREHLFKACPGQ